MEFLLDMMRSLHYGMGITAPTPERERLYLVVWLAVALLLTAEAVLILYLIA